jgi:hypothetical protein
MLQLNNSEGRAVLQSNQGSFAQQYRARQGKERNTVVAMPSAPASVVEQPVARVSTVAIQFLTALDADGAHNLVSIHPETGITEGKTFPPGSWGEIAEWIDARDGKRNLYFTPNEPRPDAPDKKLEKRDVVHIRAIFADLDPQGAASSLDDERDKLLSKAADLSAGSVPPSFSFDTGGGIQLFWFLKAKLAADDFARVAEDQGRGIKQELDGDSVQNIDRLMRLPGTLNIPNSKKRARGRTERRVTVLNESGQRYQLKDISGRFAPAAEAAHDFDKNDEIQAVIDDIDRTLGGDASAYADLPAELRGRFEVARDKSDALARLWDTGDHAGKDRTASSRRLALAAHMQRYGFSVNEYGALLWVWDFAVSPGDDLEEKLTARELARCWVKGAPKTTGAEDWFDILPDDATASAPAPKRKRFRVQSLDELEETAFAEPEAPLVEGFLDQGALSVLYGPSNAGKSFIALDLAHAVTQGRQWAGQKTERRAALYVATEGGRKIGQRAVALRQAHGRNDGDAAFEVLADSLDLFGSKEDLAEFISTASAIPNLGLVIVDTLARTFGSGEESSAKDMGAFIRNVDRIRSATKAHVMIVHHSGKDDNRGARGSSALRAAVDTEIAVEPSRGEDGKGAGGSIVVTKQRDMDGTFSRTFTLEAFAARDARSTTPIPSCIAKVTSEKAARVPTATKQQQEIIDKLADMGAFEKAFDLQEIADALGNGRKPEGLRSTLRRMAEKKLIVHRGNKWGLPVKQDAAQLFEDLENDPKTNSTGNENRLDQDEGIGRR